MYRKLLLHLAAFLVVSSCTQNNSKQVKNHVKDSALEEYLAFTDSLKNNDSTIAFFDSTEYNYKLLKAYYKDDSTYLKDVIADIERSKRERQLPIQNTHVPNLLKLGAEEAYQFNFGEPFCDFSYTITISKENDSINLHTVINQLQKDGHDSLFSKTISNFDNKLSSKNWDDFKSAMHYADYWGMKQITEENSVDGGSLKVEGVIRNKLNNQIIKDYSVQRQFVHNTAIFSAFSMLLKFAGIRNKCEGK